MTDQQLLATLRSLRATMVAVSTGTGMRIDDVNNAFGRDHDAVSIELKRRGIENTITFRDLWIWRGRWSDGSMVTYQSRREFLAAMFDPSTAQIQSGGPTPVQLTGWQRIDRTSVEIRRRLAAASNAEQFLAIGSLCRDALVSLGQEVFNPEKHPSVDGVAISASDANRQLEAFSAVELAGPANEHVRKIFRAAYDLSAQLAHRRTSTLADAAMCVEATSFAVQIAAIASGRRNRDAGDGQVVIV